jgi:hypothetical protein
MSSEKILLILLDKLEKIEKSISDIDYRLNLIDGKTQDIHKFVPFVEWLQEVGFDLSRRFKWLAGPTYKELEYE